MRLSAILIPLLLVVAWPLAAQNAQPQQPRPSHTRPPQPRQSEIVSVLNTVVTVPSADLRRLSLPRLTAGSHLQVEFRAFSPELPVEMELLRRERGGEGKAVFRHYGRVPLSAGGDFRYAIPESGDYVLALRQVERTGRSARVQLQVRIRVPSQPAAPTVYTLSREKRIAVAIFSAGFLWTTLLVCGMPIIRAFRSRRRPSSPPWYA
jgi:hypothetical protein